MNNKRLSIYTGSWFFFFAVSFVLVLGSCSNSSKPEKKKNDEELLQDSTLIESKESMNDTTDVSIQPLNCAISDDFEMDSIETTERILKSTTLLIIPKHKVKKRDFSKVYKLQKKKLLDVRDNFKAGLKEYKNDDLPEGILTPGQLVVSPLSVYADESIYSALYGYYQFYPGAAHGVSGFISFNYDLENDKELTFSDYFNVERTKIKFKEVLNENLASTDFNGCEIMDVENMDYKFSICGDNIQFSFNSYEICSYASGTPSCIIAKNDLQEFIRN